MSVYDLAVKYYPILWSAARLDALVSVGRLTPEEAGEIKASVTE